MSGSSSIVDWNALSLDQGIQSLATLLRRHLSVRLFVVTTDEELVDLTPQRAAVVTLFDHFCQADSSWGDADAPASMAHTRRRWAAELNEFDGLDDFSGRTVETEPGFHARVMPLFDDKEELAGGVVAAGFLPDEKTSVRLEMIYNSAPDHLQRQPEESDENTGQLVPQLERTDRDWLDRLLEAVAKRMGRQLVDDDNSLRTEGDRFGGMLAAADQMKSLFEHIRKVAPSDSTVLITGENGTGKELVAQAIHDQSRRAGAPFLAVNCAAIPSEVIASELFGHVKGAFSGAEESRQGLFEAADGGTILLDEIGEMDQQLQTKLLRVLQEGTIVRVGDNEVRNVDVRVLCATNTNLKRAVESGQFRRDLYFRIRVIELAVPPLRDRREDIALLAKHFVSEAAARHGRGDKKLSELCLEKLTHYDWPGNVRELKNEIERLVIMSGDANEIEARWLRPPIAEAERPGLPVDLEGKTLPEMTKRLERTMILEGLRRTGWNKSETARQLGISRRNLIRKVKQYELEQHRESD